MLKLWAEHRMEDCRPNQCLYMCIPDFPSPPWHDPSELGIDALLLQHHDALRAEAHKFISGAVKAPHYAAYKDKPNEPALGRPQGWRHWNFIESGEYVKGSDAEFPATAKVLDIIARDHKIVMGCFLVLEPGVCIPTHSDGGGWLLSYHYGLIVPDGCALTVAGEQRRHKERGSLLFNDSYWHNAKNLSDRTRVVLNLVVVNPAFSAAECASFEALSKVLPRGMLIYAE